MANLICDTNIYYNLGLGKIKVEDFVQAGDKLHYSPVSVLEITGKMTDLEFEQRKAAAQAMLDYPRRGFRGTVTGRATGGVVVRLRPARSGDGERVPQRGAGGGRAVRQRLGSAELRRALHPRPAQGAPRTLTLSLASGVVWLNGHLLQTHA